jgi:hypothetical protein
MVHRYHSPRKENIFLIMRLKWYLRRVNDVKKIEKVVKAT